MRITERINESMRSPVQRTAIYVVAFGLGSLAVSSVFSWLAVSLAENALPSPSASAAPKESASAGSPVRLPVGMSSVNRPNPAARALSATPGSKAASGRGNDSPSDASE
jgi:hypothetical protein